MTMAAAELTLHLRRARLPVSSEHALQQALGSALTQIGVDWQPEARLGAGERIDFLVGRIGIEAKTRYPKRSIFRQLERYARYETIDALILVTGTAMGLPAELSGKPLYYVSLGRSAL